MELHRRGYWSRALLSTSYLVEMKTSIIQGEPQRESGEHQSPATAGPAWRASVPSSSQLSDGEGVAARREGGILAAAGKYSCS